MRSRHRAEQKRFGDTGDDDYGEHDAYQDARSPQVPEEHVPDHANQEQQAGRSHRQCHVQVEVMSMVRLEFKRVVGIFLQREAGSTVAETKHRRV